MRQNLARYGTVGLVLFVAAEIAGPFLLGMLGPSLLLWIQSNLAAIAQ